MRKFRLVLASAFICAFASLQFAQTPTAPRYLTPPKEVVDAFDAPPLPAAILSPSKQVIALTYRRAYPTIAELSQPMLRLAGARVNPKTNGPQRTANIYGITLKKISDGTETKVMVPPQANLSNIHFSPDGAHLSFLNTKATGIELWVADVVNGRARLISGTDRLNSTAGDPCDWLRDNKTLICQFVPAGRGPAPAEPTVPPGANIQENIGKAAPAATYEDMLKTAHDDDLFEYYFTSQIAAVDATTGRKTLIGKPAIFDSVTPSPSGDYLLVTKIKRPFSHLIPLNGFPNDVEVWTRAGQLAKKIADIPSREGVPLTGVQTAPRGIHWRQDQPATVVWAEALDGGDLKNKVPFRDRVMSIAAPFTSDPAEFAKTEWRYANVSFTEKGVALLTESDRATRHVRTWVIASEPRKLWDRRQDAAYENPGTPVIRRDSGAGGFGGGFGGGGGAGAIMQSGDYIFLTGQGSSPEGDRPFIDRLNLRTFETTRLFRSDAKAYETVIAPLDDEGKTILTRYETPNDPPNYYVRDLTSSSRKAVTDFKDPQPQLRGVTHQFITYQRKDGVKLNATLYLPPGYKPGTRLPVIMWAYPRECGDADSASQITGSPNRFTIVSGYSHMFLLLSGYAVLDNPTMPIVGGGETANDTYVEQLVSSAQAAIDKVVEMGVGDRDRIGVGGHSYGAFMTRTCWRIRVCSARGLLRAALTIARSRRLVFRTSAARSGKFRNFMRGCRRSGTRRTSRIRFS